MFIRHGQTGGTRAPGRHARIVGGCRALRWRCLLAAAAVGVAILMAGCEDDDDFDHQPPAGQGSIVVDNDGSLDLHVYIDGAYQGKVRDGHRAAFDRMPGVYRVVLDESGSDRGYSADVDVLAGRLTVLEATGGEAFGDDLFVSRFYD